MKKSKIIVVIFFLIAFVGGIAIILFNNSNIMRKN